MAEEPKQDKHVKPFGLYLKTTNRGRTEADLSAKLHELIEQVLETGKKECGAGPGAGSDRGGA